MVRRLKADVLHDLPAKRRQVMELTANGCAKVVRAEQKAQEGHDARLLALRAAAETGQGIR